MQPAHLRLVSLPTHHLNALAPVLLLALASPSTFSSSGLEPDAPQLEELVHGAASELPWSFDLEQASAQARDLGRPVLLYVRSLQGFEGRSEARHSIALPEVPLTDDGYAKDVLFRCAVLSDECVAGLIERRYTPVCVTEVLSLEPTGQPTTPALVVLSPAGDELGRLDKIGVLSADRVDAWLRSFVADQQAPLAGRDAEQLFRDGELELLLRVTRFDSSGDVQLWRSRALARMGRLKEAQEELQGLGGVAVMAQHGRIATRRGAWRDAVHSWSEVRQASRGALHEEATFGLAWSKARLGEQGFARALWSVTLSASPRGRRSAACLLREGPKLGLATTLRDWRLGSRAGIDPAQSVRALIELQQPDGSFTATSGFAGDAWCDPAITGLALEALRAWQVQMPIDLPGELLVSMDRAVAFLIDWATSAQQPRGVGAFNDPLVLRALLAEGADDAAQCIVWRMQASQLAAGGWSAYGDGWTVSFLTASGVLAWLDARAAGLDVPGAELEWALDALEFMRSPGGSFPYSHGPGRAWMTTAHGAIARDSLCELALLRGGRGSFEALDSALKRYRGYAHELAGPTKRLDEAYDERGHGSYHFFYAHAAAVEAAWFAPQPLRRSIEELALVEVKALREADGTFLDHWMLGRAYGTAMALRIAAAARPR